MANDLAKLLMRLMVGGLMLFHGVNKGLHGTAFIQGLLKAQGLPEMLAYGVFVGEILAPIFLILGWMSRLWAGVVALNMLTVLYLTQMGKFLKLGAHGAWALELQMFYLISAIVIALIGSGRFAVMKD